MLWRIIYLTSFVGIMRTCREQWCLVDHGTHSGLFLCPTQQCMLGILEGPDRLRIGVGLRESLLFTSSCCCSWPSSQRTPLFSWLTFSLRVFSNIDSPSAWASCKSNLTKADWIHQGTAVGETEAGSGVDRIVSVLRNVK